MKTKNLPLTASSDSDFYRANSVTPEIGKKNITFNNTTFTDGTEQLLKQAIDKTKGALTTIYGNDFEGQLNKIQQKNKLTDSQSSVLQSISNKLLEIGNCFNLGVEESIENEVIISRKSINGISIISINEYGDIMVHYIGYKHGKKLNFYDYENFDSETIVYDFLVP